MLNKTELINIGDRVQHNFSNRLGTVTNIRHNKMGYNYKIEFETLDGSIAIDWFRISAFTKVNDKII